MRIHLETVFHGSEERRKYEFIYIYISGWEEVDTDGRWWNWNLFGWGGGPLKAPQEYRVVTRAGVMRDDKNALK